MSILSFICFLCFLISSVYIAFYFGFSLIPYFKANKDALYELSLRDTIFMFILLLSTYGLLILKFQGV